jgi:single-stranded DNA-binding protein
VDPVSVTVTGRLGDNPFTTTTRNGHPMTTLRLAVEIPPRGPGGDGTTRWDKVFAFGTLATNAAASLHKGARVVVRATDITTETWPAKDDGSPRAVAVIWACDIGPSLVFDTATTGYTTRQAGADQPEVTTEERANREVLAGVAGA